MDITEKQFYEYFRDGQFVTQEAEALARAGEARARNELWVELAVPAGSFGAIVATEAAFKHIVRWAEARGPAIFRRMGLKMVTRTTLAGATAGATAAVTGPAAPLSAPAVFAAIELYSLIEVAFSVGLDIYTMWRDYPSPDEAVDYLPASVIVQLQMAKYLEGDTKQLVKISTSDVAMAAAYVAHCTQSLNVADERKLAAYAALIGAWTWGFIPAAYLPLLSKAAKRMKPYMGSQPNALASRFEEFMGVYMKYGGKKCLRSAQLLARAGRVSLNVYNLYVVADNTIDSVCRSMNCDYLKIVAGGALDFMMSPSSYELQLPWKSACPADSLCVSTQGPIDPESQQAIDLLNSNRIIMRPVSEVNRAASAGERQLDSLGNYLSEEL